MLTEPSFFNLLYSIHYSEKYFTPDYNTSGMRVAIWGTGRNYRDHYAPWLSANINDIKFIGFFDNAPSKSGSSQDGYPIYSPEYLPSLAPECILIASYATEAIYKQLAAMRYKGMIGATCFPGLMMMGSDSKERIAAIRQKLEELSIYIFNRIHQSLTPADDNALLNSIEYILGKHALLSYPQTVGLALSNRCNAKCSFCYHTVNENIYPKVEDISTLTWLKYVKDIGLNSGISDSLTNPNFCSILEYIGSNFKNSETRITTNGISLNEKIINCVARHMDCIQISLNAASEDTWKATICPEYGSFKNTTSMIAKLSKVKKQGDYRIKTILLSMVLHNDNFKEMESFVRVGKDVGADTISFIDYQFFNYKNTEQNAETNSLYNCKHFRDKHIDKALELSAKYGITTTYAPKFSSPRFINAGCRWKQNIHKNIICNSPWTSIFFIKPSTINKQTSLANFCCNGFHLNDSWEYQSLTENAFMNIWNGAILQNTRRSLADKGGDAFCQVCMNSDLSDPSDKNIFLKAHNYMKPFSSGRMRNVPHENMDTYSSQAELALRYMRERAAPRVAVHNRMFFLLGCACSGAAGLTDILAQADNAVCLNEPEPNFCYESRLHQDGILEYPELVLEQILFPRAHKICAEGKLYGEKNPALFTFAELLFTKFCSRFVHITRDGRDCVAAMRNWHAEMVGNLYREGGSKPSLSKRAKAALAGLPVSEDMADFSRPRPLPGDPYYELWPSMTHHEMLCWYWNFCNMRIIDQLERMPSANWIRMDYSYANMVEEIFKVADFLGLSGIEENSVRRMPALRVDSIPERLDNAQQSMSWQDWSDKELEQFWEICTPAMLRLGYLVPEKTKI